MKILYQIKIGMLMLCTYSHAMNDESKDIELGHTSQQINIEIPRTSQQTGIQRSNTTSSSLSQAVSPDNEAHNSNTHLRQIAAAENHKHYFYNPILYYYSLCSAIFWDIAKDKFGLGMILFPALAMATFQWVPYAPQDQQDFYNSRGQLCLLIGMVCGTMQAYAAIVGPARERQVMALEKLWKKERRSNPLPNVVTDIENQQDDSSL